jgi:hypothetical protein
MKRLEIIRIKNKFDSEWHLDPVDINATLQAIIDRVNELSGAYCPACLTTLMQEATQINTGKHNTKRFKAKSPDDV